MSAQTDCGKNKIKITRLGLVETQNKNKMKNGTVKFYNEAKGFGFIKEDSGEEIFVHATGLKSDIRENDKVTFEVEQGKKGLNAVNVSLAD